MDDLSTLGPLALGLLAWALGLLACAPVSYTHLDVYKRQPWRRWRRASAVLFSRLAMKTAR